MYSSINFLTIFIPQIHHITSMSWYDIKYMLEYPCDLPTLVFFGDLLLKLLFLLYFIFAFLLSQHPAIFLSFCYVFAYQRTSLPIFFRDPLGSTFFSTYPYLLIYSSSSCPFFNTSNLLFFIISSPFFWFSQVTLCTKSTDILYYLQPYFWILVTHFSCLCQMPPSALLFCFSCLPISSLDYHFNLVLFHYLLLSQHFFLLFPCSLQLLWYLGMQSGLILIPFPFTSLVVLFLTPNIYSLGKFTQKSHLYFNSCTACPSLVPYGHVHLQWFTQCCY